MEEDLTASRTGTLHKTFELHFTEEEAVRQKTYIFKPITLYTTANDTIIQVIVSGRILI